MKLTKQKLKEMIEEELLTEKLKRFKVYVSGESEPLILMGKDVKSVKHLAHQMIQNSSVKIRKVVKEEKLNEDWSSEKVPYSSKEAKDVMDNSLRNYSKELKQIQYRVIKDWMGKAKAGMLDYFDIHRGLTQGDASRAHPYETEFLRKILGRDKIVDRFRKYFGGKKAMKNRTAKDK